MEINRADKASGMRARAVLAFVCAILGLGLAIPAASIQAANGDGKVRSLSKAQKKAKAKAMRKCKKIKSKTKRRACVKRVKKKYAPKPAAGRTWQVGVWDNYYAPDTLGIKVNDSINWTWEEQFGREAHDVRLRKGPKGVNRLDIRSTATAVFGTTFKRQFKVAGTYSLFCSLHTEMTMQVKVTK